MREDILNWINNLSVKETWVLVALTAVFVSYLAYKWFGWGGFWGLMIVYFFAYVLYANNVLVFLAGIV